MDMNFVLAVSSVVLMLVLTGFFVVAVRHQDSIEPKEVELHGVELLRQHYPAGATVEQPTSYWVSPIPSSPDPLESAANLDKKILAGAAMLFALFVMTGVYFLMTPGQQARGAENQLHQKIERGKSIYVNLCYDCHGAKGEGISGAGLPLNTPANKYELLARDPDPTKLKARENALKLTLARGRAKGPGQLSMPALAKSEGGPFNDAQLDQILAFIEHAKDADWADLAHVRVVAELKPEPQTPKPPALPTGAEGGKQLTISNPQASCTTCHSFTAGTASTLPDAPNLAGYGTKGPLNAQLQALKATDPQWLTKWISNPLGIKPGVVMPAYAESAGGRLTPANIGQIVEYLQSLGTDKEPK